MYVYKYICSRRVIARASPTTSSKVHTYNTNVGIYTYATTYATRNIDYYYYHYYYTRVHFQQWRAEHNDYPQPPPATTGERRAHNARLIRVRIYVYNCTGPEVFNLIAFDCIRAMRTWLTGFIRSEKYAFNHCSNSETSIQLLLQTRDVLKYIYIYAYTTTLCNNTCRVSIYDDLKFLTYIIISYSYTLCSPASISQNVVYVYAYIYINLT